MRFLPGPRQNPTASEGADDLFDVTDSMKPVDGPALMTRAEAFQAQNRAQIEATKEMVRSTMRQSVLRLAGVPVAIGAAVLLTTGLENALGAVLPASICLLAMMLGVVIFALDRAWLHAHFYVSLAMSLGVMLTGIVPHDAGLGVIFAALVGLGAAEAATMGMKSSRMDRRRVTPSA